ncbi:O-antigen ligase family protein [Roseospira marina]|nr:O-antigen ligase family protein [Roseospira marina]MBB4313903.1 hypothetical protein [Roseospira marina]MBB5087065.1 O-antigen ligase [Roseospira marina]
MIRTVPSPTRLLLFGLALIPLLAVFVAGAFASAAIAVILLGGLWTALRTQAWIALGGLAVLLAVTAGMALTVGGKPTEGVLFATTAIAALAWRRLPGRLPPETLRHAGQAFAAAAVLLPVLLLARAQIFHADIIPPLSNTPDLLAKPMFIAMALLPGALLVLWRLQHRTLAVLFVIFMAIMAVGSQSSTATLGFALGIAALIAGRIRPVFGVGIAAAIVLMPLVLSVGIQAAGVSDWSEIGLRPSWTYRLELWQRALILFEQAPLTGHGFDSYATAQTTVDMGSLEFEVVGPNHTHSAAMQLLAEGGLPALVAFGLLFALAARPPGQDASDRWRIAARLGTLAAGLTPAALGVNLWSDVTTMLVVYPLLALTLFAPRAGPPQARSGDG